MAAAKYDMIGLMSGTSLDGLDIAYCRFEYRKHWTYSILKVKTASYQRLPLDLKTLMQLNGVELMHADAQLGVFMGREVRKFLSSMKSKPLAIASHGHTVFHQPAKGFSSQIGSGAQIHAQTGLPVVCDFRSVDVALGGQGAPLVPIGDALLFKDYDYCLNLGGISNISFQFKGKRLAYDICPVNTLLNYLARQKNMDYDRGGQLAALGKVQPDLFDKLNSLNYYAQKPPKSIGAEWIEGVVWPILDQYPASVEDKLATCCEHIAYQITRNCNLKKSKTKLLVTGGGAFNRYLIKRIQAMAPEGLEVVVPDKLTVAYKEALIFAFLGLLRILGNPNALKSVTGAAKDSVGGALYGEMYLK